MAVRYTDVDQLILKRWDEVIALRDALDDLRDRMQDVVSETLQTLVTEHAEQGLLADHYPKRPSVWFWKPAWANRKKEGAIYIDIRDFAPGEYGKDVDPHPSVWISTEEFSRLKLRESAEDFGRALRSALPPEVLRKWSHPESDLSDSPVGLELVDVTEADRLRLVSDPAALAAFIRQQVVLAMSEVGPAIDQALQKMTPK